MSSITPVERVVARGQKVVFEVTVGSDVGAFTWAVTNNSGQVFDVGHHERDVEDVTTYSFSSRALKEVGGYQLRLYEEVVDIRPGTKIEETVSPREHEEATVFVAAAVPGHSGSNGDVLRVSLVQDGPTLSTPPSQLFPSFADFRTRVESRTKDKGGTVLGFGEQAYRTLMKAARQYVGTFDIHQFTDLVPKGYVEGRLQDLQQIPLVQGTNRSSGAGRLPGVELIWNYWEEEGMLVQTLNVILARFQNRRIPGRDPLARFDVSPLLPLRNTLWGFAEGEVGRLTVRRRAAEYEFEYGLSLKGRAVPARSSNVERRSAFLETFHQVLHTAHQFYKEFDDLTVHADAFPLYRALRDCHLVLSQGSENQYGEMAVVARAEFLVMQAVLAEPQMREFLGGRPMTPYPEPWMDRVDSMKSIQGWTDTSVMHFHDLATLGEQLVLSIRLGNWAGSTVDQTHARTWAQAFRSAVQKYAAAYRSVTGVDLAREADAQQPSALLARKVSGQQLRA